MEQLFTRLFEIFSLEYIFSVIIASYFIIKLIDILNKEKVVSTGIKRLVTFIVGVIFFLIFRYYTDTTVQCLSASYFAALFIYDTAIRFLLQKLDIEYKSNADDNKTSK